MNNAQSAYIIKSLCKKQKISVSKMLEETAIRKSLIYDMEKRDWTPSADVFYKLADYLGCSVDYLLGRTEIPTINGNTQFNGENHNGIQATVNTGNVTVNNEQKLEELETVLLDTFRTFKPTEKVKIVCDLVKEAEKKSPTAETADD